MSGWKNRVLFVRIRSIWTRCSLAITFSRYIHLDMQPTQKEEFYPVHCCVLECARVQLRDRQLLHADQGVVRPSTQELDGFIGRLQKFGKTETQIVFSSPVPPRTIVV